jgi:hypothetical protein
MRDRFKDLQPSGRWRIAGIITLIGLAAAAASADAAAKHRPAAGAAPTSLHARALAALPARRALDDQLIDYPSARFQDVHARIVKSVYADDEGQSDKVPWTHRGGDVLVLCGQINSRNRMGGYIGWTGFAFRPAQTDMVTMYGFESPTRLQHQINTAAEAELTMADDQSDHDETVRLLCEDDPIQVDEADLAGALQSGAHGARQ